MRIDLTGKVALITGASRGMGQVLVQTFARSGATVVCCARSQAPLRALQEAMQREGLPVTALCADVGCAETVETLVQTIVARHGRIDVLVNNAGIAGPTLPLEHTTAQQWRDTLASNLDGSFFCLRAVVPGMKQRGSGAVVNIASVTGKRPLAFRIGYAAAKMGVIGLTRTAAEELGPHGIRVNCICPGAVAGQRLDEIMAAQAAQRGMTAQQVQAAFADMAPLKSLVQPEDIARLALFLASDMARHMSGQDINVTAGAVMY